MNTYCHQWFWRCVKHQQCKWISALLNYAKILSLFLAQQKKCFYFHFLCGKKCGNWFQTFFDDFFFNSFVSFRRTWGIGRAFLGLILILFPSPSLFIFFDSSCVSAIHSQPCPLLCSISVHFLFFSSFRSCLFFFFLFDFPF